MMAFVALGLSLMGLATLALSMPRHHRDLFGNPLPKSRKLALRAAGWAMLATSFASAIILHGAGLGFVLWLGIVTVAALAVAIGLTYGPRAGPSSATTGPIRRPQTEDSRGR